MKYTQRRRGIALRVHIDDQHLRALVRQRRSGVYRGCGFTHSPLLVGHGDTTGTLRFGEIGFLEYIVA